MQLDDARGERRLEVGRVVLDADALVVVRGTEEVRLPTKEFRLLQFLLQSPGRTYTRMQLLDEIWGWDTEGAERTVDVHVNRLRTRFAGWGGGALHRDDPRPGVPGRGAGGVSPAARRASRRSKLLH